MIKYLKYEIKSCIKTYYYFLTGMIIFSLGLASTFLISLNIIEKNYLNPFSLILQILSLITFVTSIGLFIGYIFFSINYYRKDFYSYKKYLKFTLPFNGKEYFTAKVLSVSIWTIILVVTQSIMFLILYKLFKNSFLGLLKDYSIVIHEINIGTIHILLNLLYFMIDFLIYLIIAYFSITLTKAVFKDSRNGYIWFLLFNIIIWTKSFFIFVISKIFPMSFHIKRTITISNEYLEDLLHIQADASPISINIAGLIISISIAIVLYLLSIKLIDERIDL